MKKILNLYTAIFVLILLVACFFRFYQLASIPPAGSLDEVSIGWNAYSVLLTGKGEYNRPFPLIMQAYDDFRPAGYLYLVIPFVKMLGLTILAVRLPAAILSLVMVIASFFLAKILLKGYRYEKWISLSVMAFFAISPFHIYISRLGHEVNQGLAFAFFGILLFLWGILSEKKWLVVVAGISWAASFYTYQSEKVFVPLIILILLGLFSKKVWQRKKIVGFSLLLAVVLSLPILFASLQPGALLRMKGTSIFTDQHPFIETSLKLAQAKKNHNLFGEIIYNRRFVPVSIFVQNYIPHFNPVWWIGNSGLERFKAPGFGLSYWWELPLFLIGIFFLWRLPISLSIKILPLVWILISFLPAGISTESPHAMRSYAILPIPQLLEGIGFVGLILWLGKIKQYKKIWQYAVVCFVLIVAAVSIKQFTYAYFVEFPLRESSQYQYALHKAVDYIAQHKGEYNHIVISNRDNAAQSYMFYLFDTKYNPALYQRNGGTKSAGFQATHTIDNIDFRPIPKNLTLEKNTLYIVNKERVPKSVHIVAQFAGLAHITRLVAFVYNP